MIPAFGLRLTWSLSCYGMGTASPTNMRLTVIASGLFASLGYTSDLGFLPEVARSASEPLWLALWGLALIGVSGTLRRRMAVNHQQDSSASSTPVQAPTFG